MRCFCRSSDFSASCFCRTEISFINFTVIYIRVTYVFVCSTKCDLKVDITCCWSLCLCVRPPHPSPCVRSEGHGARHHPRRAGRRLCESLRGDPRVAHQERWILLRDRFSGLLVCLFAESYLQQRFNTDTVKSNQPQLLNSLLTRRAATHVIEPLNWHSIYLYFAFSFFWGQPRAHRRRLQLDVEQKQPWTSTYVHSEGWNVFCSLWKEYEMIWLLLFTRNTGTTSFCTCLNM